MQIKNVARAALVHLTAASLILQGCGKAPPTVSIASSAIEAEAPQPAVIDLGQKFKELQDRLAVDAKETLKAELQTYLQQQGAQIEISWQALNERLAALEQRRGELEGKLKEVTPPESQITKLRNAITDVSNNPAKGQELRDLAVAANNALTNYEKAAQTFTQALQRFAAPVMSLAAQGQAIKAKLDSLSESDRHSPEILKQKGDEIASLLAQAGEPGVSADGQVIEKGILDDLQVAYAALQVAKGGLDAASEKLIDHPGLTPAEKKDLQDLKDGLDEGDVQFKDVAVATLSAAASTLSTWAMASALGISLGPWGLVAVFVIAFLSALLGSRGNGPGAGSGTRSGTTGASEGQPNAESDASTDSTPIKDGQSHNLQSRAGQKRSDDFSVAGSQDGAWGFEFDTEQGNLFVFVEPKSGNLERARKLLVVPAAGATDDLKAILEAYRSQQLAFGPLEITGPEYAARFSFPKEGHKEVYKLTWSPTAAVPTVKYVENENPM